MITLARFAEHLLENGEEEFVRRVLYDSLEPTESVIKADLDHIATDWAKPGFDRAFSPPRFFPERSNL